MENKNKPAYPLSAKFYNEEIGRGISPRDYKGLTKRELFAMAAMQGLCSDGKYTEGRVYNPYLPIMAVSIADDLLKALDNEKA